MPSLQERMASNAKATADLVRRAGATEFQMGYMIEAPRMADQGWYALARWGEREIKTNGRDPIDACLALAIELLDGSLCRRCGAPISIFAGDGGFCRWHVEGESWVSGCGEPIDYQIKLVPRVEA